MHAVWSPDFDKYASGEIPITQVRCALCGLCPCDCPEFGSLEYFALVDYRHGRTNGKLSAILTEFYQAKKD